MSCIAIGCGSTFTRSHLSRLREGLCHICMIYLHIDDSYCLSSGLREEGLNCHFDAVVSIPVMIVAVSLLCTWYAVDVSARVFAKRVGKTL